MTQRVEALQATIGADHEPRNSRSPGSPSRRLRAVNRPCRDRGATAMSRRLWPRCILPMWRSSSTCSSGPSSGTELFRVSRRTSPRSLNWSRRSPRGDRPGAVRRPPAADPGGAGLGRRRRSAGLDPEGTCAGCSRRPARAPVRADPATLALPRGHGGGLMQSEYAAVFEGATVEEAVEMYAPWPRP